MCVEFRDGSGYAFLRFSSVWEARSEWRALWGSPKRVAQLMYMGVTEVQAVVKDRASGVGVVVESMSLPRLSDEPNAKVRAQIEQMAKGV